MVRKLSGLAALAVLLACVAASMLTNHSYVTTPSMYPTIPPGSEIFVSHESSYHVGEVIEFRANGLVWAHRLIKINPDGSFVTKGDNPQNAPDVFIPAVTRKDVIGAVVHAPRWLGFPELILHHPGYGLSWLRAELGVSGRIGLVAAVGLIAFLQACLPRRRAAAKDAAAKDAPAGAGAPGTDAQSAEEQPADTQPADARSAGEQATDEPPAEADAGDARPTRPARPRRGRHASHPERRRPAPQVLAQPAAGNDPAGPVTA